MKWNFGENKYQKYYEAEVGKTILVVFANNWNPDIWYGSVGRTIIHNKTVNDRQRKKQNLPKGCNTSLLQRDVILTNSSPEYMMKKVEHCFKTGKTEVCQ